MSVKVLPTCEATSGSFRSSKRPFGMLNAGNPSRTRQGLKLSFNRSISDPQSGVGTSSSGGVLHHPHKRFCPPPYPIPEEETPSIDSNDSSSISSSSSSLSSMTCSPTVTPNLLSVPNANIPLILNHKNTSRSLPCSPSTMDSPLQRSLLLSKVKTIEAPELASRITSIHAPLVVDCRSFIAYNVNHIRAAYNVNVCDRFNRKRLQHGKATLGDLAASKAGKEALKKSHWKEIIVYDDSTESLESLPTGHTLLIVLNALVEEEREPVVLVGGFRSFEVANRSYCENHLMDEELSSNSDSSFFQDLPSPAKDIENHPATKVLPHMYLGNMRDASDVSVLHSLGIGYVLNVTSKPPGYTMDPSITYKQLRAADNGFQNLHQFFEEAFEFIDLAKINSSGVLIHCQAGVSRSPTIAVAYLMKYYAMAMAEAYKFVKTRRSIISPNLNFMGQLWEFEQGLISNNKNNLNSPLRRTSSFSDSLSSSEASIEDVEEHNIKNNIQDFNSNCMPNKQGDNSNIILNNNVHISNNINIHHHHQTASEATTLFPH
ncbi:dual specificity protein phosphatase 10 [Lepeophtheirus salmonis]|nr:dual specificity protein phosphatase 10-like [Lepeophtheirus salmonis]